jgi:hypothetical protein
MKIEIEGKEIVFNVIPLEINKRNIINIFEGNKKRSLISRLNKAIKDPKDRLHKIASQLELKYQVDHNMKLGEFLVKLKSESNQDYKLFLNKYGDLQFCEYSISRFKEDKGIYCYISNDLIVYIGRSKKTFIERFKDYGKITPYNCLIDGQATNCNINAKVNLLENVSVGIYSMKDASDIEIDNLEKLIIKNLKHRYDLWNVQLN